VLCPIKMLHSETPVLKSHAGSLKVCEMNRTRE
jgi:hypothetical protein